MAAKKQAGNNEPKGYAEAISELETLLRELDSNSVDVDALSSKLERASYLIDWCTTRIAAAQMTVNDMVERFGDSDGDDEDDFDEDAEDEDFDDDDEEDDEDEDEDE